MPREPLAVDSGPSLPPAKEGATAANAQADGHEPSLEIDVVDAGSEDEKEDLSDEQVTKTGHGIDLQGLRAAYKEDGSVRLIVDHFASRERNQNETHVHRLETLLERRGATLSRPAIIRAFRRLDVLGLGRFIPGRKGHTTRFEWYEKSLSIRGLATTENTTIEQKSK